LTRTSDVKYGKYTRFSPWTYRGLALTALSHAEAKFGRPVYGVEIAESWKEITYRPYGHISTIVFALYDCHQNDEVLAKETVD
jgi:hypothetical protein